MTHTTLLILTALFLLIGACRQQTEEADIEESSEMLKRSNLVGKWRMIPLQAVDPPIVVTFSLTANGKLEMSSEYKPDTNPRDDPFGLHGYWHYARLDESRDIIIFRELGRREATGSEIETAKKGIESFQVFEVSLDGDSMIWTPLEEDSQYDWLLHEERVLKRVK